MERLSLEPFNITKAVDFSDSEIDQTWVDLSSNPAEGFAQLTKLTSPMPMLLEGGKGSGRTHLLRYFSYPLQKLRAGSNIIEAIQESGYLGIFLRCEGLNAGRFMGKRLTSEKWNSIFHYYMDLRLGYLTLSTLQDALTGRKDFQQIEAIFCSKVLELFTTNIRLDLVDLSSLCNFFKSQIKDVDQKVNNVALKREEPQINILANRGDLVFGIPQLICQEFGPFKNVRFLYLIDEFENLTIDQQQYINTLVREKRDPVSIKYGGRSYGIKTYMTLSADEYNRDGSEFDRVCLDDKLRNDPRYDSFARAMIARRLVVYGLLTEEFLKKKKVNLIANKSNKIRNILNEYFEIPETGKYFSELTKFINDNYGAVDRPYFRTLYSKLIQIFGKNQSSERDISRIISFLSCKEYPLIEKVNILLFYQEWSRGTDSLVNSAKAIGTDCQSYLRKKYRGPHDHVLSHFTGDLLAQIFRDAKQTQPYFGVDTFIEMSAGRPRNLIMILKHVHEIAVFNGEKPFQIGEKISVNSQTEGIRQASNWFFEDARTIGSNTNQIQEAIERLSTLLRKLRFSDKPVESALSTFTFTETTLTTLAKQTIEHAHQSGLIFRVISGHSGRSSSRKLAKYQISPMLGPRFNLPMSRRGVIELSDIEVNAIFGGVDKADFERIIGVRIRKSTAPFNQNKFSDEPGNESSGQVKLPGFES